MSEAINLALAASQETYKRQAKVQELQREADEYKAALILKRAEKKAKGEKANTAPNQELTTKKAPKDGSPNVKEPITPREPDPARHAFANKALPAKGTITGKQCLRILGAAMTQREDKIVAIAGFIGYDRGGEFAHQEYQARLAALREVIPAAPLKTLEFQRHAAKADPSVSGYVKGAFVPNVSKIRDLEAREILAASEMSKFFNLALCAKSEHDEKLNTGKAELAEARVKAIREELEELRK